MYVYVGYPLTCLWSSFLEKSALLNELQIRVKEGCHFWCCKGGGEDSVAMDVSKDETIIITKKNGSNRSADATYRC